MWTDAQNICDNTKANSTPPPPQLLAKHPVSDHGAFHTATGGCWCCCLLLLLLLLLLFVDIYRCADLRHRPVMNLHEERGFTMSTTFVAPCASVVGNVRIIDHSCVWYGAVIRGRLGVHPDRYI